MLFRTIDIQENNTYQNIVVSILSLVRLILTNVVEMYTNLQMDIRIFQQSCTITSGNTNDSNRLAAFGVRLLQGDNISNCHNYHGREMIIIWFYVYRQLFSHIIFLLMHFLSFLQLPSKCYSKIKFPFHYR